MYAALGTRVTRPNIAYAVHTLTKFMKAPQPRHWTAIKQVFQYIKGMHTHMLTYGGSDQEWKPELNMYCDTNWASSSDRKSISGYIFLPAGSAVSWSSKKQATIALSTAEAEYIAATHAAKQILWHQSLFNKLKIPQPETSLRQSSCDHYITSS